MTDPMTDQVPDKKTDLATDQDTSRAGTQTAAPDEPLTAAKGEGDATTTSVLRKPWRRPLWLTLAFLFLLIAAIVLPPLINIGRYQKQITMLMSQSMGRPVHLSSVELRLLPMPGFVLHDLSVSEDPAFGAEPILSARTVVATVRLLSLWRGRLAIGQVSVDEASLNLVRSGEGKWNLEALMIGPAQPVLTGRLPSASGKPVQFPYLEATNSRVNLKNGVEKSPFSVVNSDLSFWQDQPGEWRIRLRGQPVRTDTELSPAGPGEVRMEATLHSAAQLREVPFRIQMEWRDAELGQLSRILLGSDAGWRGDMRANIEVVGTSESAQTTARLRATDVRREEFAPDTLLDLDANCSFVYQHSLKALHKVACDTAIGNGNLHLTGELPGDVGHAQATLDVRQIPIQAGLDLLRTIRGSFAPGISAKGAVNGSLTYHEVDQQQLKPPVSHKVPHKTPSASNSLRLAAKTATEATAIPELQGELRLEGLELKGGQLKDPLVLPKIIFIPSAFDIPQPGQPSLPATRSSALKLKTTSQVPVPSATHRTGIESKFTVLFPLSGTNGSSQSSTAQSLSVRLSLAPQGYSAGISGAVDPSRLRDLSYAIGAVHMDAIDGFAEGIPDPATDGSGKSNSDLAPTRFTDLANVDLAASGPWIAKEIVVRPTPAPAATASPLLHSADQDSLVGSIRLRRVQWQAPYLSRPVELSQATLTLSAENIAVASDFTYGVLKGQLAASVPTECLASECAAQIQLHFGALDAYAVQTALLGAPAQKSLLSPLMARISSSPSSHWPAATVHVQADSLVLGPVTLQKPEADFHLDGLRAVIDSWQATLLDGTAQGTGSFTSTNGRPQYSVEGTFADINPAQLGLLTGGHWSGGTLDGQGSAQLSGLTDKDLFSSTTGKVEFTWEHGTIASIPPAEEVDSPATEETVATVPKQLSRFDRWSGTVILQGGKAQLGVNELLIGKRRNSVAGGLSFGEPAKFTVNPAPLQPVK
jgi:hypothetical protein